MATYRDRAVVLRTHLLGEADRIITLLSHQHGKVRAVARGVRRSSSKFGSRLEPFNHVDVQFAQGRGSLEVIAQCESIHPSDLGTDYLRFTAAEVLVEAADRLVAEEGSPARQQYWLLLGALRALEHDRHPPALIVDSYLLRALAVAGYGVAITECSGCGQGDVGWFAPHGSGASCTNCKEPSAVRFDDDARAHMGALLAGQWATA
ncbi:MAG: DNA repair protein RecO, partial [Propionibacterium sp.]|nr:DNA repair protein RecO [Propionibacterium sp.]